MVASALALLLPIGPAHAAGGADAQALPEGTGIRGGLSLVIGARDTTPATALADKSSLYVQLLQPDAKLAAQWGAAIAASPLREQIGVRHAAFDPDHYGSDLLNLIVIEDDAAAPAPARLADLCRILVPGGVVAFQRLPPALAAEANGLKMKAETVGAHTVYRKPLPPVDWKVCDSVKWRAGPRAQYCNSFTDITLTDGTLSYLERMEVPGDIQASRAQLVVRDAWNGRILRTEELPADRKVNWAATGVAQKLRTLKPDPSVKIDMPKWGNGCFAPFQLGKYLIYHHNIWVNLETKERAFPYLAHPACFFGHVPANNRIYNFPSRKNGVLAGVSAIGPADFAFDNAPGGKVLQKFAPVTAGANTTAADWPIFRASPARGNACQADPGDKPSLAWEAQVSLGGKPFGVMCGQRTGVTQPVAAWGLVVVSDIDAGRIVALDATDGKPSWVFHVGSRVDFPPSLYKGLCLFAAKDGFVYCLDAKTGKLAWRLLVAPRERYIGGQEKLENLWPTRADVLVAGGVGYAVAGFGTCVQGGVRAVAFQPESGQLLWSQCHAAELPKTEKQTPASMLFGGEGGLPLSMSGVPIDPKSGQLGKGAGGPKSGAWKGAGSVDDYVAYGNSLARNAEDRLHGTIGDGRVDGRVIAYAADLSVAFQQGKDAKVGRREYAGEMRLVAAREPKKELWKTAPIELVVDDIVLTPSFVYAVGHYERVKKDPELWVLSRDDGQVVNTVPVNGFPAFLGSSAAGNRLFVATREGKVLCWQKAK
jgi:hypothetical protein